MKQKVNSQMVTVGIYHMTKLFVVNDAHTDPFEVMFHGEKISHTPHKFQIRKVLKIYTLSMVKWVIRPHINTDFLYILRYKL